MMIAATHPKRKKSQVIERRTKAVHKEFIGLGEQALMVRTVRLVTKCDRGYK